MIVGVTGYFCSGKDSFAEILQRKGFAHISLSDMIREELRSRGMDVTIPNLTEVGNELRRHYGVGVLGQRACQHMDRTRHWVVTSVRTPGEVEALREREDFAMVFIDADQRVRFERSLSRARSGDPMTFEDFQAAEARQHDAHEGDPATQQLAACREMADFKIANDTTLEALEAKAVDFLKENLAKYNLPRPSWDEYFMQIAEVVASRANCIKRRIGAVIVYDKQILSTGYNGTPKGITNCSDGGCPRCNGGASSGAGLNECICVHAEENSLLQAAAHGVAIRGATLYSTFCPCSYCAKSIINAGIAEVVYRESYAMDEVTTKLFTEAGIKFRQIEMKK